MGRFCFRDQQVPDMFVVYFKVRHMNMISSVRLWCLFDSLEQRLACSRDQARLFLVPHHCIRLSRAGLAVGKNARVEAIKVVVQKLLAERPVHIFLLGIMRIRRVVRPKGLVEGKGFSFSAGFEGGSGVGGWGMQCGGLRLRVHFD